jgi:hypothetical protein
LFAPEGSQPPHVAAFPVRDALNDTPVDQAVAACLVDNTLMHARKISRKVSGRVRAGKN